MGCHEIGFFREKSRGLWEPSGDPLVLANEIQRGVSLAGKGSPSDTWRDGKREVTIKSGKAVVEVPRGCPCPWEDAGSNHLSLVGWVRLPETKLTFPTGSHQLHITSLHPWVA